MPTAGCSPKRTSFLGISEPTFPLQWGIECLSTGRPPTYCNYYGTQHGETEHDTLNVRCQISANRAKGRLAEPCASERVETQIGWCPQNPSGESRTLHHPSESVTHVPPKRATPRQTGTVRTPSAGRVVLFHPLPKRPKSR